MKKRIACALLALLVVFSMALTACDSVVESDEGQNGSMQTGSNQTGSNQTGSMQTGSNQTGSMQTGSNQVG